LALRDDGRQLRTQISEASNRLDASSRRHQELSSRLAGADEQLRSLDADLVRAEQERARAVAVEQSLLSERARLERELDALDTEIARNRALEQEMKRRQAKLEGDFDNISNHNIELEKALEDASGTVDAHREELAQALRRVDRWQAEAQLASERVSAARTEIQRLDTEGESVDRQLGKLRSDTEQLEADLNRTEQEVVRSRARLVEEHGMLSSAQDRERRLGEAVAELTIKVDTLDREVRKRREEHDRTRETLHAIEVEGTRVNSEWARLRDAAASDLHTTPEELLENEPDHEVSPEALQQAIDGVRARLEKLGPVNLLALQEVQELEERAAFLKEQRSDLVDALNKLNTTVREIDAVCTERFVDTLEKVNSVFDETFGQLFGGGTAYLELVDPDDPLESGIDITARPPGKKTQSVALLSGGEKALTALSLLISLFRIKPSPFCVLDEVDAPLDDANVERLVDLIHAMTDHTQFVLITHNRRTMQRSDVLYGVTMEQPGVSKLVSVRLEE
jgi:chromosome segregation protein